MVFLGPVTRTVTRYWGGCPAAGQSPQYRVTVRVTGTKNTTSDIQAMV